MMTRRFLLLLASLAILEITFAGQTITMMNARQGAINPAVDPLTQYVVASLNEPVPSPGLLCNCVPEPSNQSQAKLLRITAAPNQAQTTRQRFTAGSQRRGTIMV